VITSHFLTKPVQFERLEPIVLAAHEEVLAAKRRLREREKGVSGPGIAEALVTSPDLVSRLDAQSERLAALESELRAQRGKWRGDFWKVAFVLFLFWLAGQFGLVQKVEPHWAQAKVAVWKQIDQWKANREVAGRKSAPSEPVPANPAPEVPKAQEPAPSPAEASKAEPEEAL
jgi:hypothetical protein